MTSNTPTSPAAECERRKAAALDTLAAQRDSIVTAGRRVMVRLLLAGQSSVTADDVREEIELPAGMDPRLFGAVPGELARAGIIRPAGYVRSTRPEAHARPVMSWKLADREAAEQWLQRHPEPAIEPAASIPGRQLPLFDATEGGRYAR